MSREWRENLSAEAYEYSYKEAVWIGCAQLLCRLRACTVLPTARLKHHGALTN